MRRAPYVAGATAAVTVAVIWIVGSGPQSMSLASFAEGRQESFLLYAHLSNRIAVIERGVVRSVNTGMRESDLHHHAFPALSPNGRTLVFVRPSLKGGNEDIVLYELAANEERLLLSWPGNVWSMAWAPGGTRLALVADKSSASSRSLYLLYPAGGQIEELTPGIRSVSSDSIPSWSPDEERIAFEKYSIAREGDFHSVMVLDVANKSTASIAEGWYPSWSPDGSKLAYINPKRNRCYEVDLRSNQRRVIWWSLRTLLDDDIIGPAVWSPSGEGAMFNVTSGMEGDSREAYYVDFVSGKSRRVSYKAAFEVVEWLGSKDRSATERKPNR